MRMNRFWHKVLCLVGIVMALSALTTAGQTRVGVISKEALARNFRNPPLEYGPMDNWWWDASQVDRAKITWQLEQFKEKGIAGSWFYARWLFGEALGSDPPYWSAKWWELTRFATEEHKRLGLVSWFSTWEARGFIQNRVRAEISANPALRGHNLVIYKARATAKGPISIEIPQADEIIDAAAYRNDQDSLDYSTRVALTDAVRNRRLEWDAPGSGWLLTVIVSQPGDLDYLNPVLADRWNDIFLGEYQRRLPQFIGNTLGAFGVDEHDVLDGHTLFSPSLLTKLRSDRGYDPSPYLVGLFYDIGPKTDTVRCDYYEAMSSLLEENFTKRMARWLEQRGMRYVTLSPHDEGEPLEQTLRYGDVARYMRAYHAPGGEDPFRTAVGGRRLFSAKFDSSIAHLYQRPRVWMELAWSAGWGMTQAENLAWTHENYAYGVNAYNHHGAQHSLMGGWYEWVPPFIHFYQPYWRYWRPFADYVRRLSYIMSQGTHRADVALVFPQTTIVANWVSGRTGQNHMDISAAFDRPAFEAADSVTELAKSIYRDGIDLDIIDDSSFERATVQGPVLEISGLPFYTVVLPAMSTVRLATMAKIKDFYDKGGTVVAFGKLPTASAENGRDDPTLRSLVEAIFGGNLMGTQSSEVVRRSNGSGGKALYVPDDVSRVPQLIADAIVPDVVSSEKGVFHTHQKVGELDVYFVFNTQERERDLALRFRINGEPEKWDAFTGDVEPVYRVKYGPQATEVKLRMRAYEGIVLVFSPRTERPAVLQDNLVELANVTTGNPLTVRGFDETGGRKQVRILYRGEEFDLAADVAPAPPPMNVDGAYLFRLEPTMDNRWGDFRYPPSAAMIGAEARRFRYAEERNVPGTELGWNRQEFNDSDWPEVTYSYGPYWWHIGPFQEGSEPEGLLERAKRGQIDADQPWNRWRSGNRWLHWQAYSFSKKFGYGPRDDRITRSGSTSGLLGVSENFLVFYPVPSDQPTAHYLFTTIMAPEEAEYLIVWGQQPQDTQSSSSVGSSTQILSGTRAWVNGEDVLVVTRDENEEITRRVHLRQGRNSILLKIVQPKGKPFEGYVVFLQSQPPAADIHVPLLRWFPEPQRLIYDVRPDTSKHVGWYRFQAPPGLHRIRLQTTARRVEAWVNGKSLAVQGDTITSQTPLPTASEIALRVEQEPGTYAGAVFLEPVAFDCEEGLIPLGDWSQFGLATYSGVGVYSKDVDLDTKHLNGKVLLDLGQVMTVAEVFVNGQPAGIKMARPFTFDITGLVREGTNRIEVKVANTLANHMSTYPTRWVLEGQTVSGLLGPVQIRFLSSVTLTARPVQRTAGREE